MSIIAKSRRTPGTYTLHNSVKLVQGGKGYFDLLESLIDKANYTIHLQTYIFANDGTGNTVASALRRASERGVAVYLLIDKYASQALLPATIEALRSSGVKFRWFGTFFYNRYFYFGRRLHHKVFVADGLHSLVGGINITDRYNDLPGIPAWLDWAVYTQGEASMQLEEICSRLWNRVLHRGKAKALEMMPAKHLLPNEECQVRVRRNDWVRRYVQITRSYIEMLVKAESRITMLSSYFLPSRKLCKLIQKAVKRGVQVQVLVAGKSDVWVAKQAERYLYRKLIRYGVALYEYQPRVMHGKLSTYDGKWVTVGSYNINNISAYASVELNLDIQHDHIACEVGKMLDDIRDKDCIRMTPDEYKAHYGIFNRLIQYASYIFIRFMLFLFTFYFRQQG